MAHRSLSKALFVVSVLAVILGILDSWNVEVWLAATSWLMIAAVLGIWAIYFSVCCTCNCGKK